jgi:nucleoside-diphosphate-sugar epimerase
MTSTCLITGAGGYIGSVLVKELLDRGYFVVGVDRYFFGEELLGEAILSHPRFKCLRTDIRWLTPSDFDGVDTVFDLAGLSNDPAGDIDPTLTEAINLRGSLNVAASARAAGARRLLFASSCSVYGSTGSAQVNEGSGLNPVSHYARTKVEVEQNLMGMADPDFSVTIHRNATVCGLSPRMRFDLVVNLMTLTAWRDGRIFITGGGSQWRPLVHVADVASAFITSAQASPDVIESQVFNVGSTAGNYRIADIATIVQRVGRERGRSIEVDIVPDDAGARSYNVSFEKIQSVLGWEPKFTIDDAAHEIWDALDRKAIDPLDRRMVTVKYYQYLLECEQVMKKVAMNGSVLS